MGSVTTPWKTDCSMLPNNCEIAKRCVRNTEKRLIRQPLVAEDYQRVITSYVEKGYIRKVQQNENDPKRTWYLPRFPVCRPERWPTKTWIVFDASAKFQGASLNDHILPGPKLLTNLFDVLPRFHRFPVKCTYRYAYRLKTVWSSDFCGGIWKLIVILMYTNLNVSRSETYLPRFVPNLCAGIHEEIFLLASETVRKSTYMVDSLDSTRENDTAIQLFHERQGLRGKAGMKARKRLSNSPEILAVIP